MNWTQSIFDKYKPQSAMPAGPDAISSAGDMIGMGTDSMLANSAPVQTFGSKLLGGATSPLGIASAGLQLATTDWKNPKSIAKSAGSIAGGAIGQAAIPIPFVGAAVGSAAGSMLGNLFGGDDEEEQRKKEENKARMGMLMQNLRSTGEWLQNYNQRRAAAMGGVH